MRIQEKHPLISPGVNIAIIKLKRKPKQPINKFFLKLRGSNKIITISFTSSQNLNKTDANYFFFNFFQNYVIIIKQKIPFYSIF